MAAWINNSGQVVGASGTCAPYDPKKAKVDFLVVQDTSVTPLAQAADVVLAGATFAEKAGCYVNFQGRLQYAEAAGE